MNEPDNLFCTTLAALDLLIFSCFIAGAAAMGGQAEQVRTPDIAEDIIMKDRGLLIRLFAA
jgi:hypothetical protein